MLPFVSNDPERRLIYAARERMVKKPCVCRHQGGRFQFASELAALDGAKSVDRVALEHYLAFGYIPAPLTIYEGVRKLPPGHTLRFDGEHVLVERYWEPRLEPGEETAEDFVEQTKEALSRAVKKRLVADVPVGAFLSGGLDSSIVAGLMSCFQPSR